MSHALDVSIKALRAAVDCNVPSLFWGEAMKHVAVLLKHVEQVPDSSQALEAAHTAIAEERLPDAIQHLHAVMRLSNPWQR